MARGFATRSRGESPRLDRVGWASGICPCLLSAFAPNLAVALARPAVLDVRLAARLRAHVQPARERHRVARAAHAAAEVAVLPERVDGAVAGGVGGGDDADVPPDHGAARAAGAAADGGV